MTESVSNMFANGEQPRKILGLQLKRLGDVVLTLPAMQLLQSAFPACQVDLMIDSKLRGIIPYIAGCRAASAPVGFGDFAKLMGARYDVVLDFSGQDRSFLLSILSRAKHKVTFRKFYKKPGRSLFFNAVVKSTLRDQHISDHLADLARFVAGPAPTPLPRLQGRPDTDASAKQKLFAAGLPDSNAGGYIVAHPGTARPEKFWSVSGWGRMIDLMASRTGLPVVLTCSRDAREIEFADAVASAAAQRPIFVQGGFLLGEFLGVIQGATLLAGVDSAPIHLASALQTPVFALFGPTNPRQWGPVAEIHDVVFSDAKVPEAELMRALSEDVVLDRLAKFLHRVPLPRN